MIRPGQHNEDGLPVELAWKDSDHNEDGLPVLAPKKKLKDDFPLLYNRAKTGSMAALVDGSHPLSSDGLLKPMTQKTIKKNERPFDIPTDEIKSEAQNKIADIMYGDNEDWKDPLKVIDKGLKESKDVKTALVHSAAKDIAKESLADNGFDAKRILNESIWGKYGDENQTSKMLREKANEYDKKTEGLRKLEPDSGVYPNPATLWDLKSEALKNYAQKDNEFKRNLESIGIDVNNVMAWQQIPSVKMGSIMNDYLNDKDINTYLEKEPTKLLPQFQQAHETLLTDNKDFGINHVANKVSQAIQESGYNNIEPIFNYNSETSKGFANDVAGRVLTPQELEIYNQNIRDNQEQYLDKPSFFEGVASGIKDVYKGVGSTLEAPFQSQGQNIKDQWVKEASNVSANPEGLMKYIRGAGRGAGFVMGLVSGAEVLGGAPAAHQAMIGATVFGDALKEAETKYKSPIKAWTSAGLQTLGFMYFNNIFPSAKVGQLFNAAKPEINDIAVSLAKGEISQQAAKTVLTKVLESAGKGLKQNVSASAQMTALVGVNRMADKMFGLDPQTYEKYNSQSLPSVFGHFFLDNSVVSGLAGHSEASRERKLTEQTLMTAAQSPRQVERAINEQDPANKEELLSTVKHAEAVHKELIKNNVPEKKQGSYLLHSVAEKANKELAEQSTDPTIKAKYTDLAKKSHEIKEGILKGIPEDLIKQNQAIKEVKELYNEGFLGKQSMELLESKKTETSEPKFDEEKVKDYLKYVAQQSNNINEKGEFNTGSDARKSAEKTFPSQLRELANEMFPEYAKTAGEADADKKYEAQKPEDLKSTSVIMPEENKVAENIPLTEGVKPAVILPEENKVAEVVPLKKSNEEPVITEEDIKTNEPIPAETESGATQTANQIKQPSEEGAGVGKEPPVAEAVIEGDGNTAGITHAANEVRRKDRLLPEYEKSPQTFEAWDSEAEKQIRDGYDIEKLMDKIEKGHDPTPVENSIRKIYIATLDAEIAKNPTDELLAKQKRFIEIGDLANSRAGRNLVSLKGENSPLSSISDFYVAKMEAAGVDKLTDQQKKETKESFDNVQKADENAAAAMEAYREEISKLKAENELLKQKKTITKKGDWAQQRKDAVAGAKDALKKLRTGESGLSAVPLPGVRELIAIAPHVKKYVGSLLGEGVHNLKEVVTKAYEEFKDILDGITENDIHNILAGEFNEQKQTKNELAARMRDIQDEAYYINKLERLLKGEEPKKEKDKIKRNQQITDLQKKIKDFKKEEAEQNKFSKEEINSDVKKLDAIKKRNETEAANIKERISKGDFEQKKPTPFLEDPEMKMRFPVKYNAAIDAIKKKEDARHEFDIALLRDEMARRNFGQKATDALSKTAGTIKAITTGIDDSAFAIQTYMSILRRPRTGLTAFYEHIRQGASQRKFDRWLTALHSSSDFKEMKDAGLDVTEPTSLKEREKEEIFNNRFNGTIKINGKEYKLIDAPLKPFERAFTTLGNVTRVVGYRTISAKYKREGYTPEKNPELFKSLATRLNTETGRGAVNEYVDMANKVVTMGIWSPKLMATKFNILGVSDLASLVLSKAGTKGYYRQLHPKERAAAIRDVVQFATTVMALSYGFALAFGGDVDTDPLSSTFMDVKLPNGKSYNFTGGFSGYIRAIAQFAAGKKHSNGVTKEVNPLETAGRFFRGKVPPLTGAALNLASGKNYMGQPTSLGDEVVNLAPISLKGIVQEIHNDGTKAFFTEGIPTFFGFNVKDEKDFQKPAATKKQSKPHRQTRQ